MNQRRAMSLDWVKRLETSLQDLVNFEKSIEFLLSDLQRQDERLVGLVSGGHSSFTENIRRRVDRYTTNIGREPIDESAYWQHVHSGLQGLLEVLREHPVLDRAMHNSDGELVIGLDMSVHRKARHQVRFMMMSLVDYAVQYTPRAAADAFAKLINEGERQELNSYEMVLFRGLDVAGTERISRDLLVIPWEEVRQYIPDTAVQSLLGRDNKVNGLPIAAIASPAKWGPLFVPESLDFEGNWPGRSESIRDDALLFINLLSMTHGLGLQSTEYIYSGIEQAVESLVGTAPSFGMSQMLAHEHHSNLAVPKKPQMSIAKFAEAKSLFKKVQGAPARQRLALSRLASSLSRTGPFAELDGIVDVAIALEAMYEVNPPEQTYRLATRASYFLEGCPERRVSTYETVRDFYRARSTIVHGGKGNVGQALESGLDIAQRSLTKLLLEGGPSNYAEWDELVISGAAK